MKSNTDFSANYAEILYSVNFIKNKYYYLQYYICLCILKTLMSALTWLLTCVCAPFDLMVVVTSTSSPVVMAARAVWGLLADTFVFFFFFRFLSSTCNNDNAIRHSRTLRKKTFWLHHSLNSGF